MTVRLEHPIIRLEGDCRVEDAEPLATLLQEPLGRSVDLSACSSLHGALMQVLLAHAPPVVGKPQDAFLAAWILPILQRQSF